MLDGLSARGPWLVIMCAGHGDASVVVARDADGLVALLLADRRPADA
ncbi:hypothetical protein ACH5A7_03320 [Streptomyces sp. NPDC018955]